MVPSLSLRPGPCRTSKHQQLGVCLRPFCHQRSPLCHRFGCPGHQGIRGPRSSPLPGPRSSLVAQTEVPRDTCRVPELLGTRFQLSRMVTGSVMQPSVSFLSCLASPCPTGVPWDQLPRSLHSSPWVDPVQGLQMARPGPHARHCCSRAVQLRASSPVSKPQCPRDYDRGDNI